MADKKDDADVGKKVSNQNEVHQDMNWRSYVSNELNCAERWHNDWGFLQGTALEGKFILNHN